MRGWVRRVLGEYLPRSTSHLFGVSVLDLNSKSTEILKDLDAAHIAASSIHTYVSLSTTLPSRYAVEAYAPSVITATVIFDLTCIYAHRC